MSLDRYGVLKGYAVETMDSMDANNHYQIKIQDGAHLYRIAVNVRSQLKPKDLYFCLVDDFKHPMLEKISNLPAGYKELDGSEMSLDYIRGNLFSMSDMKVVKDHQDGPDNDLNDIFNFYVQKAIREKAFIYAFGAPWGPEEGNEDKYFGFTPGRGIHDIHMNQGNPKGKFFNDNGVWQDGGIIIQYANKFVALFLRFQSQAIHTDDVTGNPLKYPVKRLPEEVKGLRIVAALPAKGKSRGKVTIINPLSSAVNLSGWALCDEKDNTDRLQKSLRPGETMTVALKKAVLSPKGGTITLLDEKGLKIHGVSYTRKMVKKNAWVVFR